MHLFHYVSGLRVMLLNSLTIHTNRTNALIITASLASKLPRYEIRYFLLILIYYFHTNHIYVTTNNINLIKIYIFYKLIIYMQSLR